MVNLHYIKVSGLSPVWKQREAGWWGDKGENFLNVVAGKNENFILIYEFIHGKTKEYDHLCLVFHFIVPLNGTTHLESSSPF